ncbi:MAG: extracellular solute-binding protein [Anaerolineae bacterium]
MTAPRFRPLLLVALTLALALTLIGIPTVSKAAPIELTFWNYWDGQNGTVIQSLVDEYNAANPDVKITNVFVGWGELLPKLQTAAAGGSKPDIAAIDLVWCRSWSRPPAGRAERLY